MYTDDTVEWTVSTESAVGDEVPLALGLCQVQLGQHATAIASVIFFVETIEVQVIRSTIKLFMNRLDQICYHFHQVINLCFDRIIYNVGYHINLLT